MSTADESEPIPFPDQLMMFVTMPIFRQNNGLSTYEALSQATVLVVWLLKSPVLFASTYLIGNAVFPDREEPKTVELLLLVALMTAIIEYICNRILTLDKIVINRLHRKKINRRVRTYTLKEPMKARALMVLAFMSCLAYALFFTIGFALLIFW